MKNLAAFTPPTSPYPPYISINQLDDGDIEIHVRSPSPDGAACGSSAAIRIDRHAWRRLFIGALNA